jgi:hypothetical protein
MQQVAVIDPTKNVSDQLAAAVERLDDIRDNDRKWRDRLDAQTEKWRDKLDAERQRADGLARKAEAGRLDALLLANTSNVALALGKAEGVAGEQSRRLAVLEANQYQSGGANTQRAETRTQVNWDRSLLVAIFSAAAAGLTVYLSVHR